MFGSGVCPDDVFAGDLEGLIDPVAQGTSTVPWHKGDTIRIQGASILAHLISLLCVRPHELRQVYDAHTAAQNGRDIDCFLHLRSGNSRWRRTWTGSTATSSFRPWTRGHAHSGRPFCGSCPRPGRLWPFADREQVVLHRPLYAALQLAHGIARPHSQRGLHRYCHSLRGCHRHRGPDGRCAVAQALVRRRIDGINSRCSARPPAPLEIGIPGLSCPSPTSRA